MKRSKTNSGILFFFEKIIRSHPLVYYVFRHLIRYTNIFEEDTNGIIYLNLGKKVNIIDVGASDGIASKFFNRKLNVNKIICYEPNKSYVKILKKMNIGNLKVNPYGISQFSKDYKIFFPRYKFFSKNLDLITYTYYDKKTLLDQINSDFKFKSNIKIVQEKIHLKKVKTSKYKIHLIKIDVNGHELPVAKGLLKIIKRDKPALIIETNKNIKLIEKYLKKYSYDKYLFSNKQKKFNKIKKNYPLNTYFLQEKHLQIKIL